MLASPSQNEAATGKTCVQLHMWLCKLRHASLHEHPVHTLQTAIPLAPLRPVHVSICSVVVHAY